MSRSAPVDLTSLDEQAALRTILEGTATATGERFFTALVENLARAVDTHAGDGRGRGVTPGHRV